VNDGSSWRRLDCHLLCYGLRAEERPGGVDIHDPLVFIGFDVKKVLAAYHAGEAAENIDSTIGKVGCAGGGLVDAFLIAYVHGDSIDVSDRAEIPLKLSVGLFKIRTTKLTGKVPKKELFESMFE